MESDDQENQKTRRGLNFTQYENNRLNEIVIKYPIVITKKHDNKTETLKRETWKKIMREYNSESSIPQRTVPQLKGAWKRIKKKWIEDKTADKRRNTGAGPATNPGLDVRMAQYMAGQIPHDDNPGSSDTPALSEAAEQEPSQPIKTEMFVSECDTVSFSEDDSMNTEEHKPLESVHPFTFVEPGILMGDKSAPGHLMGGTSASGNFMGEKSASGNFMGDKTVPGNLTGERPVETVRPSGSRVEERVQAQAQRVNESEETRGLSTTELKRLVLLEQLQYYRKAQRLMDIQIRRQMRKEREEAAPSQW